MNVLIIRHAYLPDCTLGTWYCGGLKLANLAEPWIPDPDGPGGQRREGNLRESCIPDGLYTMRPHFSEKYPAGVWAIVNPALGIYAPGDRPPGLKYGRDAILAHSGNHVGHIEGCELVGMSHGRVENLDWVLESKVALAKMREVLGTKEWHSLTIRPINGTREVRL